MSFGEIMVTGSIYTALGMGIVFVILIFISICIWALGILCRDRKKAAAESVPAAEQYPVEETDEISPEIIAVITAAIHQHIRDEQGETESEGYIVRQVRRATWKHTS